MNLEEQRRIFESIYDGVDGSSISHRGRNVMNPNDVRYLIYGECSFDELASVFGQPVIKKEIRSARVFCDLGSGTGRILVGMSLLCPHLSKLIGVELVETLSDTAKELRKKFSKINGVAANRIKIINDNFFNVNFSPSFMDIDVIFMHYPMHNAEELYLKLEEKMRTELKSGAIIVAAIRQLEDLDSFPEIAPQHRVHCPYGNATMYYHKKI